MKAILLAAGRGTRLRPLTDRLPKCLVPVGGVPLLGIWFRLLARHGVDEVVVNTHHLAGQVEDYVARNPVPGLRVRLFHEPELLGSAGTVAANRAFFEGGREFLVLYADNLTDVDLSAMLRFHRARGAEFTMGLFETAEPEQCGIASLDEEDRIVEFVEKPKAPKGRLANSGLYVATPSLFELLPAGRFLDFGFDVIPKLAGRMYGFRIAGFFCDLGTPERLEFARREWERRADPKFLEALRT